MSLIVFKLLIFNILLSRDRIGKSFATKATKYVYDNLYVISSVLYYMAIKVQNTYLQAIPSLYKLGNFDEGSKKIRVLESIVVNNKR